MSNTYRLVNPHIEGDFKSNMKANNSMIAARSFYKNLSQHFNNNIPKFYFTIQKGGSGKGKYYHFVVKELKDDDEVKFNIEPYSIPEDTKSLKTFENKLSSFKSKFNQAGGKKGSKKASRKASRKASKKASRKNSKKLSKMNSRLDDDSDDDDDDLDSSEDFYRRAQTYRPAVVPSLYYWWYDPQVYNLNSVFIPTFYSYVTPYLQINLN